MTTFGIGNFFLGPDRAVTRETLGYDFLAFYTAGSFVREGRIDQLYDLDAVRQFEQQLAAQNGMDLRGHVGPFWNPPFYAWAFVPLAAMPFRTALFAWTGLNLAALAASIVLLVRLLPGPRERREWLLVPVLIVISMPFIQAITHGQNTFGSLLLLALVVTAWRARHDVLAGAACGLMFYKPQLAAVVATALVLSRGLRPCLGLSCTLGLLALATAKTMPDALGEYLYRLPQMVHLMQAQNEYLWDRHVTFTALWRLLIQGREIGPTNGLVLGLTALCSLAVVAGLIIATVNLWRTSAEDCWTGETRARRRDRFISASILAMPLLMPFYFDYDLLLLSVPAVLLAGEFLSRPSGATLSSSERRLIGLWVAVFVWMMINPLVARATHVNGTVILLAIIATMQIARACGRRADSAWGRETYEVIKVTARRAA